MSLHRQPEFNTPELVAALRAHGMDPDTPSQLADAFRLGWVASKPGWEPQRCEACTCTYGGADCDEIRRLIEGG